jgi:hypothetical protein
MAAALYLLRETLLQRVPGAADIGSQAMFRFSRRVFGRQPKSAAQPSVVAPPPITQDEAPEPGLAERDIAVTSIDDVDGVVLPVGAAAAVDSLNRTIERFETALDAQSGSGAGPPPGDVPGFEDAVEQLGIRARQLAELAARLEEDVARMQAVIAAVPGAQEGAAASPAPAAQYISPGDRPMALIISGVPGFQGLMDSQRALNALPAVQAASLASFRNGEATLQLYLSAPISAGEIIDTLRDAADRAPELEAISPEERLIRLRFSETAASGL